MTPHNSLFCVGWVASSLRQSVSLSFPFSPLGSVSLLYAKMPNARNSPPRSALWAVQTARVGCATFGVVVAMLLVVAVAAVLRDDDDSFLFWRQQRLLFTGHCDCCFDLTALGLAQCLHTLLHSQCRHQHCIGISNIISSMCHRRCRRTDSSAEWLCLEHLWMMMMRKKLA